MTCVAHTVIVYSQGGISLREVALEATRRAALLQVGSVVTTRGYQGFELRAGVQGLRVQGLRFAVYRSEKRMQAKDFG